MKYRFISLILTVALQLSGATVALLGRGEAGRNLADRRCSGHANFSPRRSVSSSVPA